MDPECHLNNHKALFSETTLRLQGPAEAPQTFFPFSHTDIKKYCDLTRHMHFTASSRTFLGETGCLVVKEECGASALKCAKAVATIALQMSTEQKRQKYLIINNVLL